MTTFDHLEVPEVRNSCEKLLNVYLELLKLTSNQSTKHHPECCFRATNCLTFAGDKNVGFSGDADASGVAS